MASRYFNLNQSHHAQEDHDRCKMGFTSLHHFYPSRNFVHLPFSFRSFVVLLRSCL